MSSDETPRMLGGDPINIEEVDESVDATPDVTPATFDATAFLAGVRPTRRSVQVIERADLVSSMDELAGEYAAADEADDDDACEKIADAFDKVSAAFHASKRWFTVEKRSGEWIDKFREDLTEQHGLDLSEKDGKVKDEHAGMEALLRQVAAQIVIPEGVTYEALRGLLDTNEGELNKLVVAMTMANSQSAGAAKVATPGFSLRRSEKKTTGGSTKR